MLTLDESGKLSADMGAKLSAGALRFRREELHGVTRGRILQDLPYEVDFENRIRPQEHEHR